MLCVRWDTKFWIWHADGAAGLQGEGPAPISACLGRVFAGPHRLLFPLTTGGCGRASLSAFANAAGHLLQPPCVRKPVTGPAPVACSKCRLCSTFSLLPAHPGPSPERQPDGPRG